MSRASQSKTVLCHGPPSVVRNTFPQPLNYPSHPPATRHTTTTPLPHLSPSPRSFLISHSLSRRRFDTTCNTRFGRQRFRMRCRKDHFGTLQTPLPLLPTILMPGFPPVITDGCIHPRTLPLSQFPSTSALQHFRLFNLHLFRCEREKDAYFSRHVLCVGHHYAVEEVAARSMATAAETVSDSSKTAGKSTGEQFVR